jgi:flagellin
MITGNMNSVSQKLNKSLERLSTGSKMNHSSDGAGLMLVAENMKSQSRGYDVASSNIQQGASILGAADSALQQVYQHLQNIRDIAVAASNGTTDTSQFAAYSTQLTSEINAIDSIANNTKYGTNVLLDGSLTALNIQYGPNSGDALDIGGAFTDNTATTLGIATTSITDATTAGQLLADADAAMAAASGSLATIGGFQSQLDDLAAYVSNAKSNVEASLSGIRDTDVAAETANATRLGILQQAGAYALAQANSSSQTALILLQRM